jgi:hypothetical protein
VSELKVMIVMTDAGGAPYGGFSREEFIYADSPEEEVGQVFVRALGTLDEAKVSLEHQASYAAKLMPGGPQEGS